MYTLFVILIVIAALLMIGIWLLSSQVITRLAVFARLPTSSRRPLGSSLVSWFSLAYAVHTLHLRQVATAQ